MKNKFKITILIIFICSSTTVNSQIDPFVVDDDQYSPFIAEFSLADRSDETKEISFKFKLTVKSNIRPGLYKTDWPITIFQNDHPSYRLIMHRKVLWTSDTTFSWTGPHKPGDIYEGEVSFIPIKAGPQVFCLSLPSSITRRSMGLKCRFCIGLSSEVLCFGSNVGTYYPCNGTRTFLFDQDSITITLQLPPSIFEDVVLTIKPIPKIGLESQLNVNLGNENLSDISSFNGLETVAIDIPSTLKNSRALDLKIKNQQVSFLFVPQPMNVLHMLRLDYSCPTPHKLVLPENGEIILFMLFNDDGSLRAINNHYVPIVQEGFLAKSFSPVSKARTKWKVLTNDTESQ